MADWQQVRDKFLRGANEYPDLFAYWEPREGLWTLLVGEPREPAGRDSEQLFKETARMAVALMGKRRAEGPTWCVWLDLMREGKRGFRLTLRPRNWREFNRIAETKGLGDVSSVPLGKDGEIPHVFKESADFCEDLAANLAASGVASDHSQNQSIQFSSETYDPVWNVRGGGDDPETPRQSFRRLARRAVVALGQSLSNPTEAVDAWLSRLHKFHESRGSRRYAPEHWRVNHVLEASAEYCAELGTSFHEAGNSEAERTFADLERQFRESPDPRADLTAIRRGETSVEITGAELMQPATRETTKGRKRGPKPDHETALRVADIVARVAPDGEWRRKLDDICKALDEAEVPCPATWWKRDRSCEGWADYPERSTAVKAIEYRLEIAKQ